MGKRRAKRNEDSDESGFDSDPVPAKQNRERRQGKGGNSGFKKTAGLTFLISMLFVGVGGYFYINHHGLLHVLRKGSRALEGLLPARDLSPNQMHADYPTQGRCYSGFLGMSKVAGVNCDSMQSTIGKQVDFKCCVAEIEMNGIDKQPKVFSFIGMCKAYQKSGCKAVLDMGEGKISGHWAPTDEEKTKAINAAASSDIDE
eukprot:8884_1